MIVISAFCVTCVIPWDGFWLHSKYISFLDKLHIQYVCAHNVIHSACVACRTLNSCPQSQSYSTLSQLPVLSEVEVGIGGQILQL